MSMKKGWKRYGIVLFLVLLSMLVPLVFLLGLNAGFQSSYINDEVPPTLNQTDFTRIVSLSKHDDASQQTERNLSRHLDHLNKLGSELSKVSKDEVVTKTSNSSATNTKPYIVAKDTDFNTGYNFSGTTHGNLDKLLTRHPLSGDDDVVVQRDLTPLWSINLHGKVNGAMEICEQTRYSILWRFGTFPASLITFYNMTHRLQDSWLSVGLGHDFEIDQLDIEKSLVLHFNGNLKSWLEIGINKYKPYCAKYLKQEGQFMLECNVNG